MLLSKWSAAIGIAVLSAIVVVVLAALPDSAYFIARNGPLNIAFGPTPAPLVRCLSEFTLGLLAWRLSCHAAARSYTVHNLPSAVLAVVILVLFAFPQSDPLLVLLFPLLILSLCSDRPVIARFLGSGLIYRLGVWSYAIYLVHEPILEASPAVEAFMQRHNVASCTCARPWSDGRTRLRHRRLGAQIVEVPGRRVLRAYFFVVTTQGSWRPPSRIR